LREALLYIWLSDKNKHLKFSGRDPDVEAGRPWLRTPSPIKVNKPVLVSVRLWRCLCRTLDDFLLQVHHISRPTRPVSALWRHNIAVLAGIRHQKVYPFFYLWHGTSSAPSRAGLRLQPGIKKHVAIVRAASGYVYMLKGPVEENHRNKVLPLSLDTRVLPVPNSMRIIVPSVCLLLLKNEEAFVPLLCHLVS
jgi:hypothetical protein